MNYYYDLPQDIITLIEDKVKEEELNKKSINEWKNKMRTVNKIFEFACECDEYPQSIEEGVVINDILDDLDMDTIKSWIKGMETTYYRYDNFRQHLFEEDDGEDILFQF
jgi:hypothetical protein